MSKQQFDDDCPDCRPALLDPATMKPFQDDHPAVKMLATVWDATPLADRAAFHRFTCLNSRTPEDLAAIGRFQERCARAADEEAPGQQ